MSLASIGSFIMLFPVLLMTGLGILYGIGMRGTARRYLAAQTRYEQKRGELLAHADQ